MPKHPPLAAALTLFVFSLSNAQADGAKEVTEKHAEIQNVVSTMTASLEGGRIDQVMATYDAEAIVMFEPGAAVADHDIARQIFAEMAAAKPKVTYPQGHEIYRAGDVAVHIAPWTMALTAPDGGEARQGGLSVAVLRRQPDGSWKLLIDNPHGARLLETAANDR